MGHRRCSLACWLVVGLMVAQLWLEVSAGEGMHHLKRGFRKKQIACRKECDDAEVVTPGGRRVPRRGVDESASGDDNNNHDDWDEFNVIEGLGDEVGKRPISTCVARCMSPYCFDLEYNRPLEPGEVDERYDFFRKCFTLEAAESRKRDRMRIDGEDDE